MSANSVDRVWA